MENGWKIYKKKIVFPSKWRRVDKYEVQTPSGSIEDFYITVVPDSVMVFALTSKKKIIMNKQFDILRGKRMYEMPAGYVEKGRSPLESAKRELLEETGYKATTWKKIGFIYLERWNKSKMTFFVALDAKKVGSQKLEKTEDIMVEIMPLEQFRGILKSRKLANGPTIACGYCSLDYLNEI